MVIGIQKPLFGQKMAVPLKIYIFSIAFLGARCKYQAAAIYRPFTANSPAHDSSMTGFYGMLNMKSTK